MSNTTQQRYVRILPSAVHSEYGWKQIDVGHIYVLSRDNGQVVTLIGGGFIEPQHVQEVYVYDEPREVVQPKQWRLNIDVPEWGLKKGQHSEYISNNMAKFSWQDYTASIPLSIMPYIADPVGEGGG